MGARECGSFPPLVLPGWGKVGFYQSFCLLPLYRTGRPRPRRGLSFAEIVRNTRSGFCFLIHFRNG